MIGLGRAIGETIAVALVIGSSQHISAHIFGPGDTLASIIANQFGEATGTHRAALIGLASCCSCSPSWSACCPRRSSRASTAVTERSR